MAELRKNQYRWRQIYDALKERIEQGIYKPDLPIPSESQLCEEFDVSPKTARRAVHTLREEQWVYTIPNLGTFVTPGKARLKQDLTPEAEE